MKSLHDKYEPDVAIVDNGNKTPEEIENEIMRTRAEMSNTLDEIERRLSPGQIMDEVLSYLKTGPSEFGANLATSVKHNPMPSLLVAVGLGWLMMSDKSNSSSNNISYSMTSDSMSTGASSQADLISGKAHELGSRVNTAAHQSMDKLRQTATGVRDQASSLIHSAGDATQRVSATLREKSNQLSYMARDKASRATESYNSLIKEQPLVLGALGIAIGALIGASLPRTQSEDQLLGETSDQVIGKIKEAGQEQLSKAQTVAKRVAETAQTELQQQLQTEEVSNQPVNVHTH